MSLRKALHRHGGDDVTVHGFRIAFRDWGGERTNAPREILEVALAHAIGNQTEAAYARGDLLEKRRKVMQQWADALRLAARGSRRKGRRVARCRSWMTARCWRSLGCCSIIPTS